MRRCIALGGVFLILFALALPAQAGLGDLFDEILDDPVEDLTEPLEPVTTSLPLVDDLTEAVDEVSSPLVTVVEEAADPLVDVVDEVSEPLAEVVDPVEEVVEPIVGEVEPVAETVEPIAETVEKVISPSVLLADAASPTATSTSASFGEPISDPAPTVAVLSTSQRATVLKSFDSDSIQRLLLTAISGSTGPVIDREASNTAPGEPIVGWLTSLGRWLGSGISSLLDVLAIPVRLLELLLRALTSAGAGLIAPAAILGALAVGGRRRLLPVT